MVYCGVPSRGCGTCRARKVKCDQTRPSCLNCNKRGRTCTGYRSEQELIFRNETPTILLKTHRSNQSSPIFVDMRAQSMLLPTTEQQATTLFFKNFSYNVEYATVAASRYSGTSITIPLQLAVEALSVQALSKYDGRALLAGKAAALYSQALSAIKAAIQDPNQVQNVELVIAVLFLIRYESITTELCFETMHRHMQGAVALLQARGTSVFQDKDSVAVFRGVRNQMLTEAIQYRRLIKAFPGPRGWLSDFAEDDVSPKTLLTGYIAETTRMLPRALQLLARDRTPDTTIAFSVVLNDVVAMEQKLQQWEADVPNEWHPKTAAVATEPLPENGLEELQVWPGPLHAYPSADISTMRNHARVVQILCGDMANAARAWLNPTNYEKDVKFQITRNKVQSLVNAICFSVPFHSWGHDLGECVRPPGQDKIGGEVCGSLTLIWPLSAAYGAHGIPEAQRRWLRGRLLDMSKCYGLKYAEAIPERCDSTRIFMYNGTQGCHVPATFA